MSGTAGLCQNCFSERPAKVVACPHCSFNPEGFVASEHLSPGIALDNRVTVGRMLGKGGFGITYLGWDSRLKKKVAIKEYFPASIVSRRCGDTKVTPSESQASTFQYGLAKFLQEAQIMRRFSASPNIVHVDYTFPENGTAYMVMEYLDGSTLKSALEKKPNKRLTTAEAPAIFTSILDALDLIHRDKHLHRDVSPDNIMISPNGVAKLIDFGAARQGVFDKNSEMTVILKPSFAPIEQYNRSGRFGPWTDIYATAATFYLALTGVRPPSSMERTTRDTLVKPGKIGVTLPRGWDEALLCALEMAPQDRFPTVAAFRTALFGEVSQTRPMPAAPTGNPRENRGDVTERVTVAITTTPAPVDPDTGYDERLGKPIGELQFRKMIGAHSLYLKKLKNGKRLHLSMANLCGLSLKKADLSECELPGAVMIDCDMSDTKFRKANLFGADFRRAILVGCDFSQADLRGAQFDEADLTNAILDDADCREGRLFHAQDGQFLDVQRERLNKGASFVRAVLHHSSLKRASMEKCTFSGATLSEVRFEEAKLEQADFSRCSIQNVDFTDATLDDATFANSKLQGVDTSGPEFARAHLPRKLEEIEKSLQDKIIDHKLWVDSLGRQGHRLVLGSCDLGGLLMPGVDWAAAELTNVDLADAVLTASNIAMIAFRDCNLTRTDLAKVDGRGADFSGSTLVRANLAGGDFGPMLSAYRQQSRWSAKFLGTNLTTADLTGAKLVEAALQGAVLAGCQLANADLAGADFANADLTGATLVAADLRGCNFSGALFADTRFAGTMIERCRLSAEQIKALPTDPAAILEPNYELLDEETLAAGLKLHRTWLASNGQDGKRLELARKRLSGQVLVGANLAAAILRFCSFVGADLSQSHFEMADLSYSDFRECNFDQASLRGATLRRCLFSKARMPAANLDSLDQGGERAWVSNLEGAILHDADLTNASFQGSLLTGVDLGGAILTGTNFGSVDTGSVVRTPVGQHPFGPSERRRERRFLVPRLIVDNPLGSFETADWSFGAVRLAGVPTSQIRRGQRMSITIRVPDKADEAVSTSGTVITIDEARSQAVVRFQELDPNLKALLNRLVPKSYRRR